MARPSIDIPMNLEAKTGPPRRKDIPMNLEKMEPRTGPLRRKSTGNSIIPITQTKSIIPNYLRTSTGSCHDFCKYAIKRAFPVKPWRPVGRKLDKNVNVSLDERSDKDQRGKKVLTSPKLMPMSSRQQANELLKSKTVKTNTSSHQSSPTQPNRTFLRSSSNIRESRNDAVKDIKTFKTSKKSDFLPINSSSLPQSSPKVPVAEIRTSKSLPKKNSQSEIKSCVENNETQKKTGYENVLEKIIHHVIEPKDENQNKGHAPFTTLSSNQNQKLNSTTENRKKTIRGARVIIPEEKDSSPNKLKFTRGKILEIENGNAGSIDRSLRRLVSDGKFIHKKNDNNNGVLRNQTVERKNRNLILLNTVIEERASNLVKIRKSKVMALVGAFESVIKIQDSESSRTCTGF